MDLLVREPNDTWTNRTLLPYAEPEGLEVSGDGLPKNLCGHLHPVGRDPVVVDGTTVRIGPGLCTTYGNRSHSDICSIHYSATRRWGDDLHATPALKDNGNITLCREIARRRERRYALILGVIPKPRQSPPVRRGLCRQGHIPWPPRRP